MKSRIIFLAFIGAFVSSALFAQFITINTGSSPNDGTGDALRTGGNVINSNFTTVSNLVLTTSNSLYSLIGGGGGAGSMPFNLGQFTTNGTVNIRSGALLTNTSLRFAALANATAVDSVVVLDGENQLTNSAVVSVTELDYLDGVTSSVQGQINARQGGNAVLSNLVGTAARNVTNIVSLSTSNATSKPLTNSYTSGILTLLGLEQGTNVILYANGSNIVLNASAAGGSAATNFTVTTTDHAFITNLNITGSSPGTITLSNSTGSAFVKLQMSDAGTSKTNALSFSSITPGQVVSFHDANGTMTNTTASASPSGASGNIQYNDGGSFGGLSNLSYFKASGTIQFSNNIGDGFVDFAAPVTFKSAITNEGPLYQLFPAIGESHLIYRQPDGLLTTYSTIYDMVHTNSNSTNFVTDVTDVGTPASGDLIPIVDISTAERKHVSIANLQPDPTEWTVPITGTNFIIDWSAIGKTNSLVLTNYAAAGFLNTNVVSGKKITIRLDQGSQGFCTIVPNTNYFGPNFRPTSVQTGITQSTNGGYQDFIVLYGAGTNAVLSGQNWGAAP